MSARAVWKGFLRISQVAVPIRVFPATESSDALSFNQLHAECQTRIQQKKYCPHCQRDVPNDQIVKGFEFEKGRYVVLSDEDMESVRPDSTRLIDLTEFAPAAALDPMYIDRTYYLAPDGTGSESFAILREGMKGKIGIGTVALYGREYLVAVTPRGRALVLYTLHRAAEIRTVDVIEDLNGVPLAVDKAQVKLAAQVMAAFESQSLQLADHPDAYKAGLQRIIDAKIAGEQIVGTAVASAPPIGDLREALQKSLLEAAARKKLPAKADVRSAAARASMDAKAVAKKKPA